MTENEMHEKPWESMIGWIRNRIVLKGYKPESNKIWKEEHSSVVIDFLSNTSSRTLLIAYEIPSNLSPKHNLHVSGEMFGSEIIDRVPEIAYFSRQDDGRVLNPSNIHRYVNYGTVSSVQTAATILKAMCDVHRDQIFQHENWTESLRKELVGHYHRFLATLKERDSEEKGMTLIYMPDLNDFGSFLDTECHQTVKDIESIVLIWTRQIRNAINTFVESTSDTILEEISFWRNRVSNLKDLEAALQSDCVTSIKNFLLDVKSSFLSDFVDCSDLAKQSLAESTETLKLILVLEKRCLQLRSSSLVDISPIYETILNSIRFVIKHCQIYKRENRQVNLLIRVSNEIIEHCRSAIDGNGQSVVDANVESYGKRMQEVLNSIEMWKAMKTQILEIVCDKDDFTTLFIQINAFNQRCKDVKELCNMRAQFEHFVNADGESSSNSFLSNQKTKAFMDCEILFREQLRNLLSMDYQFLDVKVLKWHDDFSQLKTQVKVSLKTNFHAKLTCKYIFRRS